MAKKLRRRRGRNERLGFAAAVVALSVTCWVRFSVGVAIVVMVLLVMFRTSCEAIVVAIVPYTLYSDINQSSRLKMTEKRAIGRGRIVKRRDNRCLRRYRNYCSMNLLLRGSLGACLRPRNKLNASPFSV